MSRDITVPYREEMNPRGHLQRQFDYFGKTSAHQGGPEAFRVDYGPERTSTPHFHSVDQFQIFFGAPGALYQRHPIPDVELHYADAFVTYGPFSAGRERIQFFTLRACQGQFKGRMPSERHKLRYQGRRGIHVDVSPFLDRPSPAPGEVVGQDLISGHDDRLAAQLVSAGPDSQIDLAASTGTSGQYVCVLSGDVDCKGAIFGPMSLGWSGAGEAVPPIHSMRRTPTRLLTMSFPSPPTPEARAAEAVD